MVNLIWHIIGGILGIFLSVKLISGTSLTVIPGESTFLGIEFGAQWQLILLVGTILGLINFFIKPILDKIAVPLKIITLGLFSLIINMGLIWSLDILFREFEIQGIISLFFTTLLVWIINSFLRTTK